MAVASWLYRRRALRRGHAENKEKKEEKDVSVFDPNKDDRENTLRILTTVCRAQELADYKKISYLKALNKIIEKTQKQNAVFFMNNEHIFRCLKTCLTSKNSSLRAAGYRVIRSCVNTPEDVDTINNLQIPKLIVRTMDLGVTFEDEKVQALKLVVKLLLLNPKQFCIGVTRSLISLAENIQELKDKLAHTSLLLLCYLSILNPDLLIECYGHSALLKCVVEVTDARLNESMLVCLMFLMNKRDIRDRVNIHLDYVINAYTEWKSMRVRNELKPSYKINEMSILAILRSWTGIYHFCQPEISGIQVIVDVLYLNQDDLRKAILELLFQIFGLDRKLWTDKLHVALASIDPSKFHESWNVNQRFIVAEGRDLLPHKNFYRPNLSEVHTALVLYAFLECGILSALVEIIVSPHTFLSMQATTLLGVIVHLSYKLLPSEIVELGPSLPTLTKYITEGSPEQRTRALTAVSAISKIHELLKRKPTPKSLFLKQLVVYSCSDKTNCTEDESNENDGNEETDIEKMETQDENKETEGPPETNEAQNDFRFNFIHLEVDRRNRKPEMKPVDNLIDKSNVLWFADSRDWNWYIVEASLKSADESFLRLEEPYHRNYIRKLVHFFKPSSRTYADIEYNFAKRELDIITTCAFCLVDFLLQSEQAGKGNFLDDFLLDLSKELKEVVVNESLYTIFFNPRHMIETMSQHYFLIIGHISGTDKGMKALNKRSLLEICTEIVCSCRHEYYVKLIISSLNYNVPGRPRLILTKAICSTMESVRNYATELLLILARLDVKNFKRWGVDILVSLMYNEDKTIAKTSVNILEELCYDKAYLDSLLEAKPSVLHLLHKGNLLLIRFLSHPTGFVFLNKANYVQSELRRWEKEYNYRYVRLIEDELNKALTLHEIRDYEKNFKRLTYNGYKHADVFIPFHLYGELAKHEEGFDSLVVNGNIFKMAQNVHKCSCDSSVEMLELKSSLWGLSNMSTSKLGFEFLDKENIIEEIVKIAYGCPVLSVRATAFYCLSLISTTIAGADALKELGWYSVRRNRSEEWPPLDMRLSVLEDIRKCRLGEGEFTSLSEVSPPDVDVTDSAIVHKEDEININIPPEDILTLPGDAIEEIFDDSIFVEKDYEHCTEGQSLPRDDEKADFQSVPKEDVKCGDGQSVERKSESCADVHSVERENESCADVHSVERENENRTDSPSVEKENGTCTDSRSLPKEDENCVDGQSIQNEDENCTDVHSVPQEDVKCTDDESIKNEDESSIDVHSVPKEDVQCTDDQFIQNENESSIDVQFDPKEDEIYSDSQSIDREIANYPTSSDDDEGLINFTSFLRRSDIDSSEEEEREQFCTDNRKLSLWDAITFSKLRFLSKKTKKRKSKTSEIQFQEESTFYSGTSHSLSVTPSQPNLVSESNQEVSTEKFELCYKGVSLPKSLSLIFTNVPKSDSDIDDEETFPSQGSEEDVLTSNLAEMKKDKKIAQSCDDSGMIFKAIENYAELRGIYPHLMENCIGCCTLVRDRFGEALPSESDQPRAGCSKYDTDNEVQACARNLPAGDENDDTIPPESGAIIRSYPDAEKSNDFDKGLTEHYKLYRTVVKEVMIHIDKMFNPVIAKAARQELVVLKERYPNVFKDVCLYSNICDELSASACRFPSRYFIQHLFNDVLYIMVNDDAARTLREYFPRDNSSLADVLPLITNTHSTLYRHGLPLQLYKPPYIKKITAKAVKDEERESFDNVPVTIYSTPVREAQTQTCVDDYFASF